MVGDQGGEAGSDPDCGASVQGSGMGGKRNWMPKEASVFLSLAFPFGLKGPDGQADFLIKGLTCYIIYII